MTTTDQSIPEAPVPSTPNASERADFTDDAVLQQKAKDHLWMHFNRQSVMEDGGGVPIIVKGQGHHIWDNRGKKYFDGLSGLFVVNAGHGRKRLAQVAAKQAEELAFFPLWSYAHPPQSSWPTDSRHTRRVSSTACFSPPAAVRR
jgi:4-aminobutyrate aminotransferase-like enzyme